ncbi:ParB/RepB/Spo0J family partition protein [Desulfobacterales bacterium HSG2]|nr:ParB/RepB/Spo0J family partition protein [Desulfobacterales bacterium HSG2]
MPELPTSNFQFPISRIDLSCIRSEDHTYHITTEIAVDNLSRSIKTVGLISPPLLIEKNSEFIVVCGFRRIAACQSLGWTDIEAGILPSDIGPLDCAKLAITDNALQRSLNPIEISRSLSMLSAFFKDYSALSKAASALGLPENLSVIRKTERLSLLPEFLQKGILSDTISPAMALELDKLEPDVCAAFSELFETLKPSLNKQREMLTRIREIAVREDMSVIDVFQENGFQEILNSGETDRNQRLRKLRSYLKRRRFPAITRAEQAYETRVKELRLGNGVQLIHPPDFEGTVYTLNLSFRNLAELKERSATLERIIREPAIKNILN